MTSHGTPGQAGPHHGPAHPGDRSSAEPGGFDEYDHPPVEPGSATDMPGVDSGEAVNTEAANDPVPSPTGIPTATTSAPLSEQDIGTPVVSDGTLGDGDEAEVPADAAYGVGGQSSADARLAAERLEDLRRLQAEYVNYKKRVDRDRSLAREQGISHVLEAMLPVLDDLHLAREHGDLEGGPFAAIAEKLEGVLTRLGIERFGEVGDAFDPAHHEALMRLESDLPEGTVSTTVVQVLQPGYRLGERVVRAARVAVADPA